MLNGATAKSDFITILKKHLKNPDYKDYVGLKEAAKAAHQAGDLKAYYQTACLFDDRDDVLNAFYYFNAVPRNSPYYQEAQSCVYDTAIQDDKLFCKLLSDKLKLVQSQTEQQPEFISSALRFSDSNQVRTNSSPSADLESRFESTSPQRSCCW